MPIGTSAQAEAFRKKFRRSGSIGIPFVPEVDIPNIQVPGLSTDFTHTTHFFQEFWNDQPPTKQDAANGVDQHHVLTLVVSPFSGVEKLAHILTNFEVGCLCMFIKQQIH
jgi:hypothetical protein